MSSTELLDAVTLKKSNTEHESTSSRRYQFSEKSDLRIDQLPFKLLGFKPYL